MRSKYIISAILGVLLLKSKSSRAAGYTPPPTGNGVSRMSAFLATIRYAEGTYSQADPYRITYGYEHVISDLSDHPSITGEWMGKTLPDNYCAAVNLSPGCKSTASGAYQIIKDTWIGFKNNNPSYQFDQNGQDAAAVYLIAERGAYQDVENGNFETAIGKCAYEWASLPPGVYGQPNRTMSELSNFYHSQLQTA